MSSLYILEIKLLSEVSLANMFSHTVGFLFLLMLFSLAMQKLFNLMRSYLFILSFMSLALRDISVKILLRGMSEIFLPMTNPFFKWTKDVNRYLTKGIKWMANKYIKRCLTSVVIREIQIKTTMRYHYIHG